MRGLSWSWWGEQHTIRMEGTAVVHRNTAELPTVTTAADHKQNQQAGRTGLGRRPIHSLVETNNVWCHDSTLASRSKLGLTTEIEGKS